jgi:hypothetical protein
MRKCLPAAVVQQVSQAGFGTCRIDRASLAAYTDVENPGHSHVFLRLTGQVNHERLAAVLKNVPGAVVDVQQVPAWNVPITFLTSQQIAWGVVLVGDHDVVLARYQGDDPWEGGVRALLEQSLRVREGMEMASQQLPITSFTPPSRPGSPSQGMVIASSKAAFLEGQVPDMLKQWPEFQRWFPETPRQIALQITRDQLTKIQCFLTPVKFGDEQVLLDNANKAKQQAVKSLTAFLKENPDPRTGKMLIRSLSGIKVYKIPRGGPGGEAPRPGPSPTFSVGGSWIISADAMKAFEDLVKSLP